MPTPPAHCCNDPLDAACGWNCPGGFTLLSPGDPAEDHALWSVAQDDAPPARPGHLEIRCSDPQSWQPQPLGRPWSVYLENIEPGRNDDLLLMEELLDRAAAAGCTRVVARGWPPPVDIDLRYRWFSLLRLLCDVRKLKFSLCEPEPVPPADRLNHYLASARGCCRHPTHKPPLQR